MEASKRCGKLIGDTYELGDVIGAGGMGIVYSAVQRSLGRRVAIKMPRAESLTPTVQRRFRTEAVVASRLWHRNVVAIIDYGVHDGVPFLVMEHVQGRLLGRLVAEQGPLEPAAATELVTQLLDALSESHASGIVHADVKPDNVLVETRHDGSSVARLFDFGLACSFPGSAERERELIYGTPHYMAPELVHGYPPSPASDLYAVGVVLYELLTGTTPFSGGGTREVLARQVNEEPLPPSCRRGDGAISHHLDALVLRALAKHAFARFDDARAFACALRALTSESPAPRVPAPPAFSTTAPTLDLGPPAAPSTRIAELRRAVGDAIAGGEPEAIVAAYMGLTRGLMDERAAGVAAAELELAVERLSVDVDAGRPVPSLWCLLIALAGLYAELGDSTRARQAARTAHEQATRACSAAGQDRAEALFAELVRSGPAERISVPVIDHERHLTNRVR